MVVGSFSAYNKGGYISADYSSTFSFVNFTDPRRVCKTLEILDVFDI